MSTAVPHNANDGARSLLSADPKGFSELYVHYYLSIFYFAKGFVDDAQQAEDITADAFIKLWFEAEKAGRVENVKAFLHVATKNACLNYLKRDKNYQEKQKEIMYLEQQDARINLDIAEIKAEVLQSIYAEIERLPNQRKQIFKLSFLEGLKITEIATQLGLSEQTVMNQKNIALKSLRIALKDKQWMLILLSALLFRGSHNN